MKTYRFKNDQRTDIDPGAPNQITSVLEARGIQGNVQDVNVKLDIDHTYTSDLRVRLIGPTGTSVQLVTHRGGSGDDFDNTTLDDQAATPVSAGSAPFQGDFRPESSLNAFNDEDANGTWSLEVIDNALQDGGALNLWEIEIATDHEEPQTGPFVFHNQTPQVIDSGLPNSVESEIDVQGMDDVVVDILQVSLSIQHTYTNDLRILLIGPDGTEVVLVESEGGSQDDFNETTFDDNAAEPIAGAMAPFSGTFRPEGQLSDFKGTAVNGKWKLRIEDQASFDGGILNSWSLSVETSAQPAPTAKPFEIKVRFLGGLTASQQAIFQGAADRWAEVIVGNLPPFNTDIGQVDDLVIDASGIDIDGPSGILGQAGPTRVRPGSLLPARGIMQFDSADLQSMEDSGELLDVIIHEMGHVLGIGTLWSHLGLIQGSGTDDPLFTGANAMREYGNLRGLGPTMVPIANTGGEGTREGHWREATFDDELMTGYDDPGRNALSRVTVASLQDIGYQVSYQVADAFFLPFASLSILQVAAKEPHQCNITVQEFEILDEANRVL
ncbi:MAG: proprotein convertase P-domain-containing protein [Cyclobacteriaceae bacterium]